MDEAKGVAELTAFFVEHLRRSPGSPWHLVLAGPGDAAAVGVPTHERIELVGSLDEGAKASLLSACDLVVMPSIHESLSIALVEGWFARRPSLVNGRNPVLVNQVRRANGGLWYDDAAGFDSALAMLDESVRAALGEQGYRFANSTYARGNTQDIFRRILNELRALASLR